MDLSALNALHVHAGVVDYAALHAWSVANPNAFWPRAWEDCGLVGDPGPVTRAGDAMESTKFFPQGRVNAARTLLDKGDRQSLAFVEVTEAGEHRPLTREELTSSVAAVASALKADGVQAGDRVAVWTPNNLEASIFAMAALSLGAVVSSAAPEFASGAVVDRLSQVNPKVLLTQSRYAYGGKTFEMTDRALDVVAKLPSLNKVIVVGGIEQSVAENSLADLQSWDAWVAPHQGARFEPIEVSFNAPGFILFSSGTTGKPKCIVHSIGGVLLKVLSEQIYHFGVTPSDRVCYYTTCGWMMWNWSLIFLGTGATLFLYNGSPVFPIADRFIDFAREEKLTFLGVSPKYLETLAKAELGTRQPLPDLETVASTGAPLPKELFDFVDQRIKPDVSVISMSGGTDICGCFVLGVPTKPLVRGEIQGPALGIAVDVFGESGEALPVGQRGELVCTEAFPSQPLGFLDDDDRTRYREAYFSKFAGTWTHGDFIERTKSGGFVIHGRSDATLNPSGIRIGTAEIYRVVNALPEILDSIVVGQRTKTDVRVVLFVALKSGVEFDGNLQEKIRQSLRSQASPRHVPNVIVNVPAVPRTVSGKIAELAVTDIVNGDQIRNTNGLEDVKVLRAFQDWYDLQRAQTQKTD